MRSSVKKGDRVVIVEIEKKQVCIRTGFICSTSESHIGVDNIKKTVVYGDEKFNHLADNADDAREKSFNVNDPHLIKRKEVDALKNPAKAVEWFADIYPPDVAMRISKALSTSNLGAKKHLSRRFLHA